MEKGFSIQNGVLLKYTGDEESLTLPRGVKVIGRDAFAGCSHIREIVLPDGLYLINEGAFADCSSLTSLTIPHCVRSISANAFTGCVSLRSLHFLRKTAFYVGAGVFDGIPSGLSVTFAGEGRVLRTVLAPRAEALYHITMGISAHGYRYPMYHALGSAFTLTARCEKDGALLSFVGEAEREKELSPY